MLDDKTPRRHRGPVALYARRRQCTEGRAGSAVAELNMPDTTPSPSTGVARDLDQLRDAILSLPCILPQHPDYPVSAFKHGHYEARRAAAGLVSAAIESAVSGLAVVGVQPEPHKFLVELPDGTMVRKTRAEMLPDDLVVFDGPDAFASEDAFTQRLEAEIAAAGGIDAWRAAALASSPSPQIQSNPLDHLARQEKSDTSAVRSLQP